MIASRRATTPASGTGKAIDMGAPRNRFAFSLRSGAPV
jgi:hypothetical protein